MGTHHSQAQIHQYFNINEWNQLYFDSGSRILQNKRNKQLQIQENSMLISNQRQMQLAQQLLALRKQDLYLVTVLHYQIYNQARLSQIRNQGAFSGLLYTERIPIRLSQVKNVPFPDILHIYAQATYGFEKLSKYFGYFIVNSNCIGVNSQNIAKVWHHPNFASIHPYQTAFSQQDMVSSILDTIQKCTNPSTAPTQQPSFKYFVLKQQPYLSFEAVKRKLYEYSKYYNNGIIPKECRCSVSRGKQIDGIKLRSQQTVRSREDSLVGSQIGNQSILQKSIVQQQQFNNNYINQSHMFMNGFTQPQTYNVPQPVMYPAFNTPNLHHNMQNNHFISLQPHIQEVPFNHHQHQNVPANYIQKPIPAAHIGPFFRQQNNMINNVYLANLNRSFEQLPIVQQSINQPIRPVSSVPQIPKAQIKRQSPLSHQSINQFKQQRQNRLQLKSSPGIHKFASKITEQNNQNQHIVQISKPRSIPTTFQFPPMNRSQSHDKYSTQFQQPLVTRQRSTSQFNRPMRSNSPPVFFNVNSNPTPVIHPLKISQQFTINNQMNVMPVRQVHRQLRPASIKQSIQGINFHIPMTSSKIKSEEEHLQSLGHNFAINNNNHVQPQSSIRSSNTFINSSFAAPPYQSTIYESQTMKMSNYQNSPNPVSMLNSLAIATDEHDHSNQSQSLASPSFGRVQSSDSQKWQGMNKFVIQNNKNVVIPRPINPAFAIQNIHTFKDLESRTQPKQVIVSPRPDLSEEAKQNQQTAINNSHKRTKNLQLSRPKSPIQIGGISNQSFSSIGFGPGISRQITDKFFHDVRESESINNSTRNFYNTFLNSDISQVVQPSSPLDFRLKGKQGTKIGQLVLQRVEPMDDQSDTQSKILQEHAGGTSWDLMQKLKLVSMTQKQDNRYFEPTYKNVTPSKIQQQEEVRVTQKKSRRTNSDNKLRSGSKQFNKDVAKLGFAIPQDSSSQKGTASQKSIKQATTYQQTVDWSPTYNNSPYKYISNEGALYKASEQSYKPKDGQTYTSKYQQQNNNYQIKYPSNNAYGGHNKKKSYTDMYLGEYLQNYNPISSENSDSKIKDKSNNEYIDVMSSYKIENATYSVTNSMNPSSTDKYEFDKKQQTYKFDWDPELLADMESKAFNSISPNSYN